MKMSAKKRRGDVYDIVSYNIKKYRKSIGITQAQLAERCQLSHEYIRRIEAPHAKKYFSIDTLVQIAKALDIKMEDLFEGIDNINLDENINKKNIQ